MSGVFQLQQACVRHVHPSWFPDIPVDLIAQCKDQVRGRRWLAGQLKYDFKLMDTLQSPDLEQQVALDDLWGFWCCESTSIDEDVLIRLGSFLYADSISRVVSGALVRHIINLIGKGTYSAVLKHAHLSDKNSNQSAPQLLQVDSGDQWFAHIRKLGYWELMLFAHDRHPLLVERVRMAQPKHWFQIALLGSLYSRLNTGTIVNSVKSLIKEKVND